MALRNNDGRYMPVLGVLLLCTLAGIAWLLYTLSFGPAGKPAAVETLLNSQAAALQAEQALEGDDAAFAALRNTSTALRDITAASLGDAQRARLGKVRESVETILDGQGDVIALRDSAARIRELEPKFAEAVYALQGELSL